MEQDSTRICELLVGLGDVDVLGVVDEPSAPLVVHVRTRHRPRCSGCGGLVWSKDTSLVRLVYLPAFGHPVRLLWHKYRWFCPAADCVTASFTAVADEIAPVRSALTTRAGRWATTAVGRDARAVSDVAAELGCDWHTVNKVVLAWGRRCWPPMSSVWVRLRRWGSMRPCSVVRVVGGLDGGAPRSWTCVAASCSTLWLVATRRHRSGGCWNNPASGVRVLCGALWISQARTVAVSMWRCHTLVRSLTRFM